MRKIVDKATTAKVYCSDGDFTYKNVIFPGKHIQNNEDKRDTHGAESADADLRTYRSGFRRRRGVFAGATKRLTRRCAYLQTHATNSEKGKPDDRRLSFIDRQ